ncbi:MAG: sterol desaturase family protein, partial [Lysobacterales bacterium]
MEIVLYAIPGFIFLILVEWLYGLVRGRNTYRLADTIASISLGSISRVRILMFLGLGTWFYAQATHGYHLFDLPQQGWGIWLFALLAYDFSYYWFHRVSHEVNLFWAAHVVHHQSEDYNLGTALRQSGSGLFEFIFYLPWLYIGVPPEILVTSGAINLVYQFWVHTEHVPKLGWLETVFVTASNHRVHHAQNDIYIDRNYGGIWIIWDRLFGSFQEELAEQPCVYGIRKPLHSYNPLWANVHVYWSVFLDAWRAPRWQDKFSVWFKSPGWRPAGLEVTHPVERSSHEQFRKYDPPVDHPVGRYAFFQFFCTTLAAVGMLVAHRDWTSAPWVYVAGLVLFSFYVQSTWTE